VNLAGFFHITPRCIRQMLTQGSGHIVNISTSLVDGILYLEWATFVTGEILHIDGGHAVGH
jgi:hypothetical protein